MPSISVYFFRKPELKGNEFVRVAKIIGDENVLIDALNESIMLEKKSLKALGKLPDYCMDCHKIIGVEVCQDGKFLFFRHCCGIKSIITLEKIKGFLICAEFNVIG